MNSQRLDLSATLARVRARWQRLRLLHAWRVAASVAAVILIAAYAVDRLAPLPAAAHLAVWIVAALAATAIVARRLMAARTPPADSQVARFIEERCPELDDVVATAVAAETAGRAPAMVTAVLADALRQLDRLDFDRIVSQASVASAVRRAAAASLALVLVLAVSAVPAVRAGRLFGAWAFPDRSSAQPSLRAIAPQPPHVQRIDLRYEYPSAFRMEPRIEEDGGDIYAPAGTRVHLSVHADKALASGALTIGDTAMALTARGQMLEGTLTISKDGSYRVALADQDGLTNPGDTEYFIRTLEDRPPDVRIVRPASDRQVTPLEEVTIEARADDDFGVATFDLVYSVRGGAEQAVPFNRVGAGMTVNGRSTIYLEDLRVAPGDFVSYYARARDVSKGKRSTEARSDIFFLEVTPFEQEFAVVNGSASGGDQGTDDLVEAQKDVVSATWRLDRRARDANASSQSDIRAVGRAQLEIRNRTLAAAAQMQRAADVQRRRATGAARPTGPPPVEESEDALTKAAVAMSSAQEQLEALKTGEALPFEMRALGELLRAQADVRRREVSRQQTASGGSGRGGSRQQQDLSSLFDRELARQQQTNYEPPRATTESKNRQQDEALDKVRELARRQEALNRDQEGLKTEKNEQERKRQLERLTREQIELRQQAEQMARQFNPRTGSAMQGISDDMRAAANDLRRQDPQKAGQRGSRALEQLQQLEKQMGGSQRDDNRRSLNDLQLESRQIADAQRQLNGQAQAQQTGTDASTATQRRADEQNRLANRTARLEQAMKDTAQLSETAREFDRQNLPERMRNAAKAQAGEASKEGESIARQLERLGEQLGEAAEGAEAKRLGEELSRLRDLQQQLANADRQANQQQAGQSPWDGVKQLLEQMQRDGSLGPTPDTLRAFNPGRSAPGTEAWKQDFSKWEQLKTQIAAALEKAESSAAAQLRAQQAQDRLNAGASQSVPEQYRQLVEKYYRALASKPQGSSLDSAQGKP